LSLVDAEVVGGGATSSDDCVVPCTGWYLQFLDPVFLGIYVVELLIKFYALRKHFFFDAWNWFGQLTVPIRIHTAQTTPVADLRGARGHAPPRCQRWHLNNPSTAKVVIFWGTSSPRPPTGPPPLDPAGDP